MSALAGARLTSARERTKLNLGVAAAVLCYAGGLAVLDASGNVKPGVTATGLRGLGRFKDTADNSLGIAAAINADVEIGVFQYGNSAAGDAIAQAHIGRDCYVVDDQTVALTDGAGTRSKAGTVADVDANGVWVDFTTGQSRGKVYLPLRIDDTVAADARVYGIEAPCDGTITNIRATLERHVIVGADATITGKIGATAITGGVVTAALAGTTVGNSYDVQPTAANVVKRGDRINFTVGGGNTDATAYMQLVIEITQ
jgi:hypothetical protein